MKDLKVKALFDQIVSALLLIIDRFGNDNLLHSKQVAVIAAALSEIVIPKKKDIIFYASLLQDVGAVIFGEHPAMFPSLEEQKRVPRIFEHPTISSKIISRIGGIKEVQLYIQDHHEWYNGNGYPNRKKGKNIPVGAQIIRIADTIAAKTQVCGGNQFTDIYNYLRLHKGKEFDPNLWDAILDLKNKDAGSFFIRVSDNNGLHTMFAEVIKSVNPYKVISTAMKEDYVKEDYIKIILHIFAEIIDAKDKYTRKHMERVAFFSEKIARSMELPQAEIEQVKYAACLHDIGKLYVPLDILSNAGYLSKQQEIEILRRCVIVTMEIIDSIDILRNLTAIAGFHQERYDGKGYPDGLSNKDIPIGARILAVANAVDAMLSDKPYRKALSVENTIIQLQQCSETQFDPKVVTVAISLLSNREILEDMRKIKQMVAL